MGMKLAGVALYQLALYLQPHIYQRALRPMVTGQSPPPPTVYSRLAPALPFTLAYEISEVRDEFRPCSPIDLVKHLLIPDLIGTARAYARAVSCPRSDTEGSDRAACD